MPLRLPPTTTPYKSFTATATPLRSFASVAYQYCQRQLRARSTLHSTRVSSAFWKPILSSNLQTRTMSSNAPSELRFKNPAILVCDMQEKFRNAIYEFDSLVLTQQKLLTFANSLDIPIHTTTQTVAKLGPTVPSLAALLRAPAHDKTRFSMFIPAIAASLPVPSQIALVGIETHICITQTALDLRDAGHSVYVLADAVSSCNPGEVGVALDRLRAAGVTVTTSESWMYECLGDAAHPGFKGLIGVVKESVGNTKKVLQVLPPGPKI